MPWDINNFLSQLRQGFGPGQEKMAEEQKIKDMQIADEMKLSEQEDKKRKTDELFEFKKKKNQIALMRELVKLFDSGRKKKNADGTDVDEPNPVLEALKQNFTSLIGSGYDSQVPPPTPTPIPQEYTPEPEVDPYDSAPPQVDPYNPVPPQRNSVTTTTNDIVGNIAEGGNDYLNSGNLQDFLNRYIPSKKKIENSNFEPVSSGVGIAEDPYNAARMTQLNNYIGEGVKKISGPVTSVFSPLENIADAAIRKDGDKSFYQRLKDSVVKGSDIGGAMETQGMNPYLATPLGFAASLAIPGLGELNQVKKVDSVVDLVKGLDKTDDVVDLVKGSNKIEQEALKKFGTTNKIYSGSKFILKSGDVLDLPEAGHILAGADFVKDTKALRIIASPKEIGMAFSFDTPPTPTQWEKFKSLVPFTGSKFVDDIPHREILVDIEGSHGNVLTSRRNLTIDKAQTLLEDANKLSESDFLKKYPKNAPISMSDSDYAFFHEHPEWGLSPDDY